MRHKATLLGFVLGMLMVSPLPAHAEQGSFQVMVDGVTHTIDYQAVIEQVVSDLRDPARFDFLDGVFVFLEVFDPTDPKIIRGVSVKMSPTPIFPEGVDRELGISCNDPGDTGIDFFGLFPTTDVHVATFEFVIKLTTRDKIRIGPFPITLKRLPDLQNVQFLDNTTKPVITWGTIPGVRNYRVKVIDLETKGCPVFVTNTFPAAPGDVQTLDLKFLPTGGAPIGWPGMEVGKRYVIRIEGRLFGPNPVISQFVNLPATDPVPGPTAGAGRITRARRFVEYTPLCTLLEPC